MTNRLTGGLAVAAAVLCGAACASSSTSSSSVGGVATNPPASDVVGTSSATPAATSAGTGGPTQSSGIRTVIAPLGLNLRDQPSTSGNVIGSLAEGTVLTVVGNTAANGGWYQVKGETRTGWITADPRYSTARHLTSYGSSQHGFSTLYPDTWSFTDNGGATVLFAPQSGGADKLTVSTGPSLSALGSPGAPGYAVTSGESVEVFGVTGTLRLFDNGGTSASSSRVTTGPGSGSPAASAAPFVSTAPHVAEILLSVNAQNAMRIDFEYADPGELAVFTDIYDSMKIYAALPTPAATATP